MAIIGTFTKTPHGYRGRIETLGLVVDVELQPNRKDHEKAPDYRILASFGEIGAAWQRVSSNDRDYLSCKLDAPILPAPVYASLVLSDDDENYHLIWSR